MMLRWALHPSRGNWAALERRQLLLLNRLIGTRERHVPCHSLYLSRGLRSRSAEGDNVNSEKGPDTITAEPLGASPDSEPRDAPRQAPGDESVAQSQQLPEADSVNPSPSPSKSETSSPDTPSFLPLNNLQNAQSALVSYASRQKDALVRSVSDAQQQLLNRVVPEVSSLLNTATGYNVVQDCKNRVIAKDAELNAARRRADNAKRAYEATIEERRKCQKERSALLERKDSWVDTDVDRFTQLYRKDLSLEQNEAVAKQEYNKASEDFDRCHREYLNEIRERYIEEQLYSDKIRKASTWWTWGLISLHFALFVIIQLVVEPRKRAILRNDLFALIKETSESDKAEFREQIQEELAPILHFVEALRSQMGNEEIKVDRGVRQAILAPIIVGDQEPAGGKASRWWLSPPNQSFLNGLAIGGAVAGIVTFALFGR
ncbi:sensitivity to high expression protein she9 [Borealophlyctis nickersoniae]|nr:sensitivity to high expression protein she9 [Borealophlyctis nickersoniae]